MKFACGDDNSKTRPTCTLRIVMKLKMCVDIGDL